MRWWQHTIREGLPGSRVRLESDSALGMGHSEAIEPSPLPSVAAGILDFRAPVELGRGAADWDKIPQNLLFLPSSIVTNLWLISRVLKKFPKLFFLASIFVAFVEKQINRCPHSTVLGSLVLCLLTLDGDKHEEKMVSSTCVPRSGGKCGQPQSRCPSHQGQLLFTSVENHHSRKRPRAVRSSTF